MNKQNQTSKTISKLIYLGLGTVFSLGGAIALFSPKIFVPESEDTGATIALLQEILQHTTQELGTAIIGVGSIMLWAAFNLDKVKQLNYIFLLFFLLFGGIHWMEYFNDNRTIASPLINSIPILLMLIVIYIRRQNK